MQQQRKNEHCMPGSDDLVFPITVPWIQNEDYGWDDEPAVDYRTDVGQSHSI